jgi:uncharacterized protein (DUF4415 family)
MKFAIDAKWPRKISVEGNDSNNPGWKQDMLGAQALQCGYRSQATPIKVFTSGRLGEDILEFFKSGEAGVQRWINAALRIEAGRHLTGRPRVAGRTPVAV